jgi:hypothetical protein
VTVNGKGVAFSGSELSARLDLTEGNNSLTLVVVDDVGNTYTLDFWVVVDTTTNCIIFTPKDNPEVTDKERIVVGGRCDPDVVLRISSVPNSVTPDAAGYWSATVGLAAGANVITIEGLDSHGAQWYAQVSVTYRAGDSSSDPTILIVFALLAGVVLAAAFFVSRRPPRAPEEAEPPRPATGSQKAPPRPSPTTMKLPETPEDLTYQPQPPSPPTRPPPKV